MELQCPTCGHCFTCDDDAVRSYSTVVVEHLSEGLELTSTCPVCSNTFSLNGSQLVKWKY